MRNRIGILLLSIHCLAFVAAAQRSANRQLVLQVTSGGFISFKSETSAADNNKPVAQGHSLSSLIYSQALADENRIIHRVLTDSEQRVMFGYDLLVNSDPLTRTFNVAVLPANDDFRRAFLKNSGPPQANELFATFPNSAKPQTLDDGDAISLELLVNPAAGLKIIDVVTVTFDSSRLLEKSLEAPPKDFTLDAVALTVKSYEVFIDGTLAGKGKSTVGCTGALLWLYVPDGGRFIFSLAPRDGYLFQKIGVLDGNRIEFIARGKHYEWISNTPILPNGGTWNLWVLQDAKYTPLFSSARPAPKGTGPNIFQRFEENMVVKDSAPGFTMRVPGSAKNPSLKKPPVDIPTRVMVGGADNMDHLLPKSP